ncbi:SusC/RagA family TonB-linked outer membrane protein [Persicobacter diffluens]|uniref:SusC/RagA family TonB-linked outer membrane protein n=1 Tax=Persicobacter diffluens TaxID=981 RepID=A0AAN5AIL0_9BACT|nr:SusC/RagA family TonB-linked outer membrane protein [Persicobacter diffluens]
MKKMLLMAMATLFAFSAYAQGRVVTGTVTAEESGDPIPGVNVLIKGEASGTITDIEGKYSLDVPSKDTRLVFTFIGLATEEVLVGGQSEINLTMKAEFTQLTEVVVTGYSEFNKKSLSGSIAVIDEKALENVPVATFDQMLQGQASGLYINAGSGQPGTAATIRIRGNGSILGGNDPLYIMDGVPIEADAFAAINPNDISSVNVLKDASSTALYGSRGANGVIVITTKQGKSGATRFNYSGQYGITEVGDWRYDMMNTEERLRYEEMTQRSNGWAYSPNNPNAPDDAAEKLAELKAIDTDWAEVATQLGRSQNHQLSMTGGKGGTSFYISGNYFQQDGVLLGSDLNRYSGRFNIKNDSFDRLKIDLNSYIGYSDLNYVPSEGLSVANPMVQSLNMPYQKPIDDDGNYTYGPLGQNPLEWRDHTSNSRGELKANVSLNAKLDVWNGIFVSGRLGLDYRNRKSNQWRDPEYRPGSGVSNGGEGLYSFNDYSFFSPILLGQIGYAKEFGKHKLAASINSELIQKTYSGHNYTGYGINGKLPNTPGGITQGDPDNGFIASVGGFKESNALLSYFLVGDYSYNEKYNLTFSLRRDASSKFGENNQWATLGAVGASWVVSDEDFFNSGLISFMKVRASYGVAGNQDDTDESIGSYQRYGVFQNTSGYAGTAGIVPASIANPDLKWETSAQFNLGVDVSAFNDRVSLAVDVYNNITSDLFLDQKLSYTSGQGELRINAGEMRNRGIEFVLNTTNVQIGDFKWTTSMNYSYNENEIMDLGQVSQFENGTSLVEVGKPLGSHYSVGWGGVDPANGQPLYLTADGALTPTYSEENSTTNWGTSNPPHIGGITNNMSYKGFDFSFFFSFQAGHKLFNNQLYFIENHNVSYNQTTRMLDMWQQPGDVTNIAAPGYAREFSSYDIEDGSFIKLKNVQLGYTLPSEIIGKTPFNSLRIYAQGQNLMTWTKFSGFDPEIGNNIAQFQYPIPRIYTMGIDLSF